MRVAIDPARCAGHGRCYAVAPELFEDDDRGYGHVRGDGRFSEQYRAAADRARSSCPERAIDVAD